ncbi:MAG: homoserine dehydrogenase [Actinomycetaceae bacterium]|nr:homoserine dehydrogenase [Actinomycetaceae bacterium]
MTSNNCVRIGLLGCGTVGSQVVRLLQQSRCDYEARSATCLTLQGIAVSRLDAQRPAWVDTSLLTTDANKVVDEADVVIELIGGIDPAHELVVRALTQGKTVVTGNKALLASHGKELFELCANHNASLYYEAAVAGAVPVVYGLRESLTGDRINCVQGIVNGTTNYILDKMDTQGWSYEKALSVAQELGFAEADPTADVDGLDAGAKCALLASLAFHSRVTMEDVSIQGISHLSAKDMKDAKDAGCTIKLIAEAKRIRGADGKDAISAVVAPMLIGPDNPLFSVGGAFNAILIDSDAAGRLMFYGQGAGGAPTASAVLSDVVAAAFHCKHGGHAPRESTYASLPIVDKEHAQAAFRIRLSVHDEIGVLHRIAGIVAQHGISISGLQQSGSEDENRAHVVVTTHVTTQGQIDTLLNELRSTPELCTVASVIRQ